MKYILISLLAVMIGISPFQAQSQKKQKPKRRSIEERFPSDLKQTPDSEARLDLWYRDAKFGAFIHFGVYSMLGGVYNGIEAEEHYSEWIRRNLQIPPDKYHEVSARFNPVGFNADEWVEVFKNAGMKYVVITAKHHDGFALFKSMVSDYNIVDYTPFKRDVIKELSEACQRHGLKFGVYYSHAKDWDEPDATDLNIEITKQLHPDLSADFTPNLDRYIANKSLPQVEELVKNYELDMIWFDTPHGMNAKRAKLFSDMVWKYRPNCLINSRILYRANDEVLAKDLPYFDFASLKDKEFPTKKTSIYLESPDCVSNSYGYKKNTKYHSAKEMIDRLVHTVCNEGNYLLNNGPMGNGQLDPEAVRLYGIIGEWMQTNAESIHNTRSNPFDESPVWGDVSISKDGKKLYLHILEWPESRIIQLHGLKTQINAAIYLANGEKTDFVQNGDVLKISLPAEPLDEYNTVIKVSY